jgi:hypothetical protein
MRTQNLVVEELLQLLIRKINAELRLCEQKPDIQSASK